jgi:hypothetical protein
MEVQVNMWAILLATASSMAVGAFWYSRPVFGDLWIKLAKLNPKAMEKRSAGPLILTAMLSFVTAYTLAHVSFLSNNFFHHSFLRDAVTTAFWLWLGLTAARIMVHDIFESRAKELTLITIFHEAATILIMGVIIGLMKP